MINTKLSRIRILYPAIMICALSVGCSSAINSADYPMGRVSEPSHTEGARGDGVPTALINNQPIDENEFRNLTTETSGRLILNEMAIDRALHHKLNEIGISISDTDIQREQQTLLRSLDPDPEQAVRLLRALRKRRSLGPTRYANLLKRNASLRLLVRDSVSISEERLHEEYSRWYGPRYRIRLLTLDSRNKADEMLRQLRAGASFNELATKESTDLSAERGGLLAPFSNKDPSYPASIREVVGDLLPGEISPVIPIDNQYAIVQMLEHIPAQKVNYSTVRNNLLQTVRRNEERRLMDVLARELLAQTDVVILDPVVMNGDSY